MGTIIRSLNPRSERFLDDLQEEIALSGVASIPGVLSDAEVAEIRDATYIVKTRIERDIGEDRLRRAGEIGTLRLPMAYHPVFFRVLQHPLVLNIVDTLLSPTAILHLQNAFVLPSFAVGSGP